MRMNNREIRSLAMYRRKTRGFSRIMLAGFLVCAALLSLRFATDARGAGLKFALDELICLAAWLLAAAGLSRASVEAWNEGAAWNAKPARAWGLFAHLTSGRLFRRALAVALLAEALPACARLLRIAAPDLGGDTVGGIALALGALLCFNLIALVLAGFLFCTLAAAPEEPLGALIPRALKLAIGNLPRLVGMAVAAAWVPALLVLFGALFVWMIVIQLGSALTYWVLGAGMGAMLIAIVWVYAPYVALCMAGLAVEIIHGARTDAPEGDRA